MQDQHFFQLGETLLLVTIERQSILIDGEIAGFVEILSDKERRRSEARIWLYPRFRSHTVPIRRWIEQNAIASFITEESTEEMGLMQYEQRPPGTETLESVWAVGLRAERPYGFEVFLTDRVTGFLYPIHSTKRRRDAFTIKSQIEADLLILSADAFAEKWGLQRIYQNSR